MDTDTDTDTDTHTHTQTHPYIEQQHEMPIPSHFKTCANAINVTFVNMTTNVLFANFTYT
jgi:hypothetical protein